MQNHKKVFLDSPSPGLGLVLDSTKVVFDYSFGFDYLYISSSPSPCLLQDCIRLNAVEHFAAPNFVQISRSDSFFFPLGNMNQICEFPLGLKTLQ